MYLRLHQTVIMGEHAAGGLLAIGAMARDSPFVDARDRELDALAIAGGRERHRGLRRFD